MKPYQDTAHFKDLRSRLVDGLKNKGISSEHVLRAVDSVPRQFFMPEQYEELSYEDRPFPIGEEQTISQPYTVAYQTQLLEVQPTDRILEIGTGSAYQAAILAVLADEVFSIERQRRLFEKNREFGYIQQFGNLYLFYGDGYEGLPEYAPFDKVLITAAAPFIPPKLLEQLKQGGLMVLPLGKERPQKMVRVTKLGDDQIREEHFDNFSFVPMLEGRKG
jgi:protein-L-isoaspartate(D-aspartate) O-methyltransferase